MSRIDPKFEHISGLNELADHVWEVARNHGFHDDPVPMATALANIHGEVSECWEAYRRDQINTLCDKAHKMKELGLDPLTCIEEELADILIRVLDTAKEYKVNIGRAVVMKDAYNQSREYKHSKIC